MGSNQLEEIQRTCENSTIVVTEYVNQLLANDNIDAIFYMPCVHSYHGMVSNPIIQIIVIASKIDSNTTNKVNELNSMRFNVKNNLGVDVAVELEKASDFSFNPTNKHSLDKLRVLSDSTLLYDSHGLYGRMQQLANNLSTTDSFTGCERKLSDNSTHSMVKLRPFVQANFKRS